MPTAVRLHKLLAEAGVASRRAAERLIAEGRVSVNGTIVREPGSTAVLGRDDIRVDGRPIQVPEHHTYLLLHKPPGSVTSLSDPHADRTIADLLPAGTPRVVPVGRLDRDSEGLLLLTDDGELVERLLHPRYGVEREYAVLVRGKVTPGALARLREGIDVDGVRVVPADVRVMLPPPITGPYPSGTRWLRITVREGRRHEVRAMCAAVHLRVLRLVRVRFGPLVLGDLPQGAIRPLTEKELRDLTDLPPRPPSLKGREREVRGGNSLPLPLREGGRGGRSDDGGRSQRQRRVRSKTASNPRRGRSSAARPARGRGRGG
jgi:23S rRNA pseudouridine2605 synthase